jgi:hypothetical protein
MKTRVESVIARGTTDLFGEPDLPDGFRYIPDVLSHAEEASFVQRFEKLPMKPFVFHGYLGKRRIFTFGHKYVFAGQEPRVDPSIPDYFRPLTDIASHISGVSADEVIGRGSIGGYTPSLVDAARADGGTLIF